MIFTSLSKSEFEEWKSALVEGTGPQMEAIRLANGVAEPSAAVLRLMFLSVLLQGFFRKFLIMLCVEIIPTVQDQFAEFLIGFFIVSFELFKPRLIRCFHDGQFDRFYWLNGVLAVCWDFAALAAVVFALQRNSFGISYYSVVLLMIFLSTYLVFIGWLCCTSRATTVAAAELELEHTV
jgi:hypothetical protein